MGPHCSLLWHPYTGPLPAPAIDFSNMIDNSQHLSRPQLRAMLRTLLTVYEPYEPIVQQHSLAGSTNAGFVPLSHVFSFRAPREATLLPKQLFLGNFPTLFHNSVT